MMNKKPCNKITPCNVNAQLWYMTNAINKIKTTKNPYVYSKQYAIANYYLNGQVKVIKRL